MKKIADKIIESNNIKKTTDFLKKNKRIILSLISISIFVDIFLIKTSSDIIIFSILLLYGIFTKISQIKSKRTFLLCLAILTAMFINYLFTGPSIPTEKAAVWLFLFLALGIFQQWRE